MTRISSRPCHSTHALFGLFVFFLLLSLFWSRAQAQEPVEIDISLYRVERPFSGSQVFAFYSGIDEVGFLLVVTGTLPPTVTEILVAPVAPSLLAAAGTDYLASAAVDIQDTPLVRSNQTLLSPALVCFIPSGSKPPACLATITAGRWTCVDSKLTTPAPSFVCGKAPQLGPLSLQQSPPPPDYPPLASQGIGIAGAAGGYGAVLLLAALAVLVVTPLAVALQRRNRRRARKWRQLDAELPEALEGEEEGAADYLAKSKLKQIDPHHDQPGSRLHLPSVTLLSWLIGSMDRARDLIDSEQWGPLSLFVCTLAGFVDSCLRAFAQVLNLDNPLSGSVIIVALFIGDVWLALNAIVGCVAATLQAALFRLDYGVYRTGAFGYSGVLIGAAMAKYLQLRWDMRAFVPSLVMPAISTMFTVSTRHVMGHHFGSPGASHLPYNICALMFLLGAYNYQYFPLATPMPGLPTQHGLTIEVTADVIFEGWIYGISQIYLLQDWVSSVIIIGAMTIASPVAAFMALIGSAVGVAMGYALGVDPNLIRYGWFSYNQALSAAAVAGIYFELSWQSLLMAVYCAVVTSFYQAALIPILGVVGMPTLTLAYTWASFTFAFLEGSVARLYPLFIINWESFKRSTKGRVYVQTVPTHTNL